MHPFFTLKKSTGLFCRISTYSRFSDRATWWTGRGSNPTGYEIFLFSKRPMPSLGSTKPSIQWVPGFFPGAKRPGSDGNPSTPSCAEIKNEWSHTSIPSYAFMACNVKEVLTALYRHVLLRLSPSLEFHNYSKIYNNDHKTMQFQAMKQHSNSSLHCTLQLSRRPRQKPGSRIQRKVSSCENLRT